MRLPLGAFAGMVCVGRYQFCAPALHPGEPPRFGHTILYMLQVLLSAFIFLISGANFAHLLQQYFREAAGP